MRGCIAELLKVLQDKTVKCCYLVIYEEVCDTCDSKKYKTPVSARVRVRAREGDYRYFYNSDSLFSMGDSWVFNFTSCVLVKNDVSFYGK